MSCKDRILSVLIALLIIAPSPSWAVNSKVTRITEADDFLKGETENIVIGSRGTISLGLDGKVLAEKFEDVWSINSLVTIGSSVYLGTSPNGEVYEYVLGKLNKIYPENEKTNQNKTDAAADTNDPNDPNGLNNPNDPNDPNAVDKENYLTNNHIFAMTADVAGRLLVAVSGENCALYRYEKAKMEKIYEPNDAKYIFALITDKQGNIYLGTGPQGKIYKLDAFGKNPELFYDSTDKNILSLAADEKGNIYAGSDTKGLIYKINSESKQASVLYDAEQDEVTALFISKQGDLYAAATSAQIQQGELQFAPQKDAGRPDANPQKSPTPDEEQGGLKLEVANTTKEKTQEPQKGPQRPAGPPQPDQASYIYKVSNEGFVKEVFSQQAVFFSLTGYDNGKLLLGTGTNAKLFSVDPDMEDSAIIYKDDKVSQITAVVSAGEDIYIATANPAKLIKLNGSYASTGQYESDLVDAEAISKWGMFQIEADIPQGTEVLLACRSGNVADINDPTYSKWTPQKRIEGPTQMDCPPGRFAQYKLILKTESENKTPLIREVVLVNVVPNIAPRVQLVKTERIENGKGVFKLSYTAEDENKDKLLYRIEFKKLEWKSWIELKDETDSDTFEWDARTVEDGRYEIRITASDEADNTPQTKLTASRISDPLVVDNTGPVITDHSIEVKNNLVVIKFAAEDQLSMIGKLEYTVDSNAKWKGIVPDDMVYDTTSEKFTIEIEGLKTGEHIIALKISDDLGNTTYKTFTTTVNN